MQMGWIVWAILFYLLGFVTANYYYPLLMSLKDCFIATEASVVHDYRTNWNYTLQTGLYDLYPKKRAEIVMLGDSHTYRLNWSELFPDRMIVNRGVDGDTTAGFISRLPYIEALNPEYICICGGYNDFRKGFSADTAFANLKTLIEKIQRKGMIPIVQSTPQASHTQYTDKITQLNNLLKVYCDTNNIVFIDLNKRLTVDNLLLEEYTYDGVHLNANGYTIWKEELERVFSSL